MLIDKVILLNAEKTAAGYTAEIEFETEDGLGFGGSIEFDKDWNYSLGFLNTFVNTDEDRYFINGVLSGDDFKNDILAHTVS